MSNAIEDISDERLRQLEVEGFSTEHDDLHADGELAAAAACYALAAAGVDDEFGDLPEHWPWHFHWWKPDDPRRMLVKAGALIVAEIERLDRVAGPQVKGASVNNNSGCGSNSALGDRQVAGPLSNPQQENGDV